MTKISIIVPIYNVEKYIKQALNSIINQTLKDIEIVCINDCTPDNSFEIVKEYANKDSRFVLIEQESNQGQGVARNKGLDIATGEYIMFLDPDDWLELDACELAYNQISKNNNDIVFFNLYKFNEKKNTKEISKKIKTLLNKNSYTSFNLSEINNYWFKTCWVWSQIYSRDFLQKNKVYFSDKRFSEDLQFFIQAITLSQSVSLLKEAIYNYRIKKTEKTFDYTNYYQDSIFSKENAFKIIKKTNCKKFLKQYLLYEIRSNIVWLKSFCKENKKIRDNYYQEIRKRLFFIYEEIKEQNININVLEKEFVYQLFQILQSKTYIEYKFRTKFSKILFVSFFKQIKI